MASSNRGNSSQRRVAKYEVTYSTLPSLSDSLPAPTGVTIIQKQKAHEVAIIDYPLLNAQAMQNLKTGVPVSFTWSKNGSSNTWVGYVSFISSQMHGSPKKKMEVHCIHASFPFKAKKPRVFKNKTIPQVAEILAKELGFKFVGEPNSRIFNQLVISGGQSYWEWLHTQADRIGYAMMMDGTTLVFRPIDKLIDHASSNAPVLSYFANDMPTDTLIEDRTLDHFSVKNGEYIEGSSRRNTKVVGGVNPVTGKILKSSKSPSKVGSNTRTNTSDVFFEEHKTSQVVHDSTAADAMAAGAAHSARFTTPATVRCQGDTRIKPYSPVYVEGISDSLDGYWIPTMVKHILTINGEYQIEMEVAADGTGANVPTATRAAKRNLIGVVDLYAALKNGGVNPAIPHPSKTKLTRPKQLLSETKQGYNRTPAKWTSGPTPPRKGK